MGKGIGLVRIGWLQAAENKYNQLLFTMILMFLTSPLRSQFGLAYGITSSLFLAMIMITVRTLGLRRRMIVIYQAVTILLFLALILPSFDPFSEVPNLSLRVLGVAGFSFFLGLPIIFISRDLFRRDSIDADTIKGGICVYILIGLFWALLYDLVFLLDSSAYTHEMNLLNDYIYFSFTTLTTLGYGDISPTNLFAQSLTNLEAIIGQMYPAILIARLVSLYGQNPSSKSDLSD